MGRDARADGRTDGRRDLYSEARFIGQLQEIMELLLYANEADEAGSLA